jgi:sugar O-acyltransferase (sialic acid O-acetyltransferase NeuD family)
LEWFSTKDAINVNCPIAIGDSKLRYKIVQKIKKYNVKFPIIIHPSVIHSKFVEFGEGTIIQAGCIITVDAKIGNHVHINLDCTVGHDCIIKDFVTLTPGVHISGRNIVHSGVYFGTGAVTLDRIEIGRWSIIGAGAVLIENVQEFSLYVGVPAKLKKKLDSF